MAAAVDGPTNSSFSATTPTARPRRTPSAATSRSTRSSTTSGRSRSSITSAACRISIDGSSAASAIPTCGSSRIPSGCCARSVLAARLQFTIDEPVLDAISTHAHEIAQSAPARLIEEFYKILRSGHAEEAFRQLRATGLLREMAPEMTVGTAGPLWQSIAAIDRYRARFEGAPDSLTSAILAGALLVPLGLIGRGRFSADALERRVELGMLPISRRDVDRLQQILSLQPRLLDLRAGPRSQRGLLHRAVLDEALTWLEIHGDQPDVVAHWRALQAEAAANPQPHEHDMAADAGPPPAFRRRRRRRPRRVPSH